MANWVKTWTYLHRDVRMHAKSLQSCPTLCDPMNRSLPGSSLHGDSPGKNTGVDCYALLQGIFLTQGSNLCLFHLPSMAGGFLNTSTIWEAPEDQIHTYICMYVCMYVCICSKIQIREMWDSVLNIFPLNWQIRPFEVAHSFSCLLTLYPYK